MAGQFAFLVATICLMVLTEAQECSTPPIYVDIHKRKVDGTPDANVFQYGSFIGVGTPSQNQSIWPSLSQNEMSFAGLNFCKGSTLPNCDFATGGKVDVSKSESWKPGPNSSNDVFSGTETIHMWTHYLPNSPPNDTEVPGTIVQFKDGGDGTNPGILGVGSSSTLIQRLFEMKKIAARTYSLYIGTGFDRAGGIVNGSNTFGGYDKGRFKGVPHTYNMDLSKKEYLPLTISNIQLSSASNPSADPTSLMSKGDEFTAFLTTDHYPLVLPPKITKAFMDLTASTASTTTRTTNPLDDPLIAPSALPNTLTITLSSGLTIPLPPSILSNTSSLTCLSATPALDPTYQGPYYLSTAFLTQVYLMLDFDARKFHLAPAVQFDNYVMPQPWCGGPDHLPVANDYATKQSGFVAKGLVGAVVGAILGGSFFLVAAAVLFFWWRARRARRARDEDEFGERAAPAGEKGRAYVAVSHRGVELTPVSASSSSSASSLSAEERPDRRAGGASPVLAPVLEPVTRAAATRSPTLSRHSSVSSLSAESLSGERAERGAGERDL